MNISPEKFNPVCELISYAPLLSAMIILSGCGDKPSTPQSPPPKLFQEQREALDKAKSVGQTEAKSAEDLRREEEKQTK